MINGDFYLIDPIMTLRLSSAGIALFNNLSPAGKKGAVLRTSSHWLRATKRLQLDVK